MKKILYAIFIMASFSSYAGNLAIIDTSGDEIYIQGIGSKISTKNCFSSADFQGDFVRPGVGGDPTVIKYFRYYRASACPNANTSDNSIGSRSIADRDTTNNGIVYTFLSDEHLTEVADIALQFTDQPVSLLGAGVYDSPLKNIEVSARNLESKIELISAIDALDYLLNNHQRLNIRVVNMSFGSLFHEGDSYCDDKQLDADFSEFRSKLETLSQRGVALVAAAGNDGDKNGQEFPACLSYVISVGGFTEFRDGSELTRTLYGATSRSIDYLDDPFPSTSYGNTVVGTSYAAPKVAGAISRMMSVNPQLSTNEVLSKLRSSANSTGRIYYPNNPNKYDTNRLFINIDRAITSSVDQFWNIIYKLNQDSIQSTRVGWNFGTGSHKNGAQFRFDTPPSNKLSSSALAKEGESVVRFSLTAYDIDTEDELQIIVNGKSYGHVNTTASNSFGSSETICIPTSELNPSRTENVVLLRLKQSGETWGVKDVGFSTGVSDSSCKQIATNDDDDDGTTEPQPDQASLTLGTVDTTQYGQNYGNNANTDSLQVTFTPVQGRNHTFSWKAYDISSREMTLFLNGQKIKDVDGTIPSSLGSKEEVTLVSSSLQSGQNTLTFQVSGGNEIWGITDLLVRSVAPAGNGEAETTVLLDRPETVKNFVYTLETYPFQYSPRSPGYLNTVTVSLDSTVVTGFVNGIRVWVNNNEVIRVNPYLGKTRSISLSAVVDNSFLRNGSNSLTIATTSDPSSRLESFFENVKIVYNSIPQHDLMIDDLRKPLPDESNSSNKIFSAMVNNIGLHLSRPNTLTYYASDSADKSNPRTLAIQDVGEIAGGDSRSLNTSVPKTMAQTGDFIWACLADSSFDANNANNCSAPVQIKTDITSIILLLFDDD